MIEVKGFFVFCPGDISAGIFNQEWKIDGEFFFDDEKELNQFKDALKEAWSWYSDPVIIDTIEERENHISNEDDKYEH